MSRKTPQSWTAAEQELSKHWRADGMSWADIRVKLLARRKRHAAFVKPKDGERGPAALSALFKIRGR